MNGDELDAFINSVLDEKQLSGVDDAVKTQLVSDLKKRLLDQIDRAVIGALSADKIAKLNELLDDPTADEAAIRQYIQDSGVDVKRVTIQTMLRFRDLYLKTPEERAGV